ncbi:MAG: 16S rRNA (adenine(1518)-N(6)/adenine(1519)-N(6)) -dimethyltransferase RsmA [Anaerolineae bacterium]
MSMRHLLEHLQIEPKKSLGQNFMVEPAALERIVDAADLAPDDVVLEIGAGLGALTDLLARRARRVVALEVDDRVLPFLRQRYADDPHVSIVRQDILEADIAGLLGPDVARYKVVANVPYYITSAILRHLLESPHPPRLLVITMQREVAQRITAGPGDMSLLAVSVQFYGAPRIVARLKPGVFYPPPNVQSAVVCITPHAQPYLPPAEWADFFHMVRAGFSQKRKQLKNCLSAGLTMPIEQAAAWLERAGIDPRRRAETLSIAEWLALYAAGQGLIR